MKMIMFDFRDSEKDFFDKNKFNDFEITFIEEPLNKHSDLNEEQLNDTSIISVFTTSDLTEDVLKKFKIKFENNLSFIELYELLPNEIKEYLQNDIYFSIETFCSIKDNHLIYEYYTNNEISFEHMKFFLRFIPRLKTVIFNIKQNNLYI